MNKTSPTKNEFNLSEKIEGQMKTIGKYIPLKDIKEFIRLLKEEIRKCAIQEENEIADAQNSALYCCYEIIDKLAGDKLI